MKKLKEIIQQLKLIKISNEEYYRLIDLKQSILLLDSDKIEVSDCILTPYYIQDNRRLELYEYEFSLRVVNNLNFNGHLLELTGRKNIYDVLPHIIERQKVCYVELLDDALDIKVIKKYIDYLYDSKEVRNQVETCFGNFNINQLFFEIY